MDVSFHFPPRSQNPCNTTYGKTMHICFLQSLKKQWIQLSLYLNKWEILVKNNAPEKYRCPHTWLHSMAWWHVRKGDTALHFCMCTSASVVILRTQVISRTFLSARYGTLFKVRGCWMNEQMGCRTAIIIWSAQVTPVPSHPHSILVYVSACVACAHVCMRVHVWGTWMGKQNQKCISF